MRDGRRDAVWIRAPVCGEGGRTDSSAAPRAGEGSPSRRPRRVLPAFRRCLAHGAPWGQAGPWPAEAPWPQTGGLAWGVPLTGQPGAVSDRPLACAAVSSSVRREARSPWRVRSGPAGPSPPRVRPRALAEDVLREHAAAPDTPGREGSRTPLGAWPRSAAPRGPLASPLPLPSGFLPRCTRTCSLPRGGRRPGHAKVTASPAGTS